MSDTFKGLKVNDFESISGQQWEQLNKRPFVFIEKQSQLMARKPVKRKRRKPLVFKFRSKRRPKVSSELYWAQSITDCRLNSEFELLFFVKWDGYDESQNTWQSVRDLFDCNNLFRDFYNSLFAKQVVEYSAQDFKKLKDFLKDLKNVSQLDQKSTDHWLEALKRGHKKSEWYQKILCQEVVRKLGIETQFGDLYHFFEYCDQRKTFSQRLNQWLEEVNDQIVNEPKLTVENQIDFEVPPKLRYLSTQMIDEELVVIPSIPGIKCDCKDDCRRTQCCCALKLYRDNRRFKSSNVIYECNDKCRCSLVCGNRRIQRGRTTDLTVFKTRDRGWAVKTAQKIKWKQYIGEYVGKVLDSLATRDRDPTYFFSIDSEFCGQTLFVDGKHFGNVTRFINHSCDPNLIVHLAWVDGTDRMPRIAFFANRDIEPGEELTYNYAINILSERNGKYVKDDNSDSGFSENSNEDQINIRCLCGSDKCKGFI